MKTCRSCRHYNPREEDKLDRGYCEIMLFCQHSFEPIDQSPDEEHDCDGFDAIHCSEKVLHTISKETAFSYADVRRVYTRLKYFHIGTEKNVRTFLNAAVKMNIDPMSMLK